MGMRTRNRATMSEEDNNNKDTDHTVDGVRIPSSSSSLEKEEEQQGRNTKDDDTAAPDAQTDADSDCHRDDAPAREVAVAAADKNDTAAAGPMDRAVAAVVVVVAAAAASVAGAAMRWWKRGRCVLRSPLSGTVRILPGVVAIARGKFMCQLDKNIIKSQSC